MPGLLLELHQPRPDMIQQIDRQTLAGLGMQPVAVLGVIADHLMQAIHTDG